ncbi:MAG: rhamnogalacturonan acetylesterase [Chitinophagaceae bacterium]|nr:rhamnogalacturonan acetylesterase [Chitinophagaceae bacterium]
MKAKWLVLLVACIALSSFSWWQERKITLFMAGDSTMSIKETKAYPETGWGMPFVYFWDSSVTVVNKAKNGRSTKTFISEGLWKSICDNIKPGEYVFIQFGHNDEAKDKVERYTTPEEYTTNLLKFVNETKAKQGIPVLLTPVSRRRFDKEGKATETHTEYSALVRTLAAKENVLMIDLDKLSMDLYQQFGAENSKWLFLQLQPNEHPNYPEGKNDNTHFNELGARLVAQLVLSEIKKQIPELAVRLVKPIVKK